MDKDPMSCECGHTIEEHRNLGPCEADPEDCNCMAYKWDEDLGGAAVTRSIPK